MLFAGFGFAEGIAVARADDALNEIKGVAIKTSGEHYYLEVICSYTGKPSSYWKNVKNPITVELHADSELLDPLPLTGRQLPDRGILLVDAFDKVKSADYWYISPNLKTLSSQFGRVWTLKQFTTHSTFTIQLPSPDSAVPNAFRHSTFGLSERK